MTLLEEFENRYREAPADPAKKILFAILGDVFDRKGLDHEWDNIDADVKEELLQSNLVTVRANLS